MVPMDSNFFARHYSAWPRNQEESGRYALSTLHSRAAGTGARSAGYPGHML